MDVRLENITFMYNENKIVFKGLDLNIKSGEVVAIIGHNGSGKSTLAKIIMGLLECKEGSLYLNNEKVTEDNVDSFREHMGIIFQNPDNQFVGATVKDDVAFGLENRCIERTKMEEIISKYLDIVGMKEYIDSNPEELSGGQKQRVAVADILACDPDLIIFDESTSMLDPVCTKDIMNLIKEVATSLNKTIIIITHNLEEALIADRVIVLKNGVIKKDDTPQEVFKDSALLEECGLKTVTSLELYNKLKDLKYKNKSLIEAYLWESTFKM